jgi:hypothetical protein
MQLLTRQGRQAAKRSPHPVRGAAAGARPGILLSGRSAGLRYQHFRIFGLNDFT